MVTIEDQAKNEMEKEMQKSLNTLGAGGEG